MAFRCTVVLLLVLWLSNIHISSSIASAKTVPQAVVENLFCKDAAANSGDYKKYCILRQYKSVSVKPGFLLKDDDIIETKPDQKLKVSISPENIKLTFMQKSKASIFPSRLEVELLSGKLHYAHKEREKTITSSESFVIRSARNFFIIRGTTFTLSLRDVGHDSKTIDENAPITRTEYTLEVNEGSVGIKPVLGPWKEVIVEKGFRAIGLDGVAPKLEQIIQTESPQIIRGTDSQESDKYITPQNVQAIPISD